jgi:hypothetical protein
MIKKKESKNYFTQDTENAIIAYNLSTDSAIRSSLFDKEIYYPFYKLAENIIHTFKTHYTGISSIEELKHDVVYMLLIEKIHKYDPALGYKAYSYFSVIVKRWLINNNNKNYKELKQVGDITEREDICEKSLDYEVSSQYDLSTFIDYFIDEMYQKVDNLFVKEKDKVVADAVLTVFKDREELLTLKKKALYIYIREITECKTPQLTKVVNILKAQFYNMYNKHLELGLVTEG